MTTIRKVAKHANVSIATVSRVLNNHPAVSDEVRARVLASVNSCGYVANVGRRATSFLALVYTGPMSLGGPYDAALCAGFGQAMQESDLDLVILNAHRDKLPSETYTQFFFRKGVRGVILRTTTRTRNVCEQIAEEGYPAIVLGDRFENPKVNTAYCDSRPSSIQAVDHLAGLGHQRIALAISDLIADTDHLDRLASYERALAEQGLAVDPKLVFRIPPSRPDGAQVIRKITSMSNPPTAVYITDPLVAVGALNEAHQFGLRIPEDLSLVGFDDADLRHGTYPRMTAVCQDAVRLGSEVFSTLAAMVRAETKPSPAHLVLPTWLEINATTGRVGQEERQTR